MTLLSIIGGITIFFFNPFMGHLIDKYGERKLLVGGGIICTLVYAAYALLCTQPVTDSVVIFALLALNYVDRLTQSTLMGRDIFVKHTADTPDEIMPTLSVGVSMDHIASVVSPIFGGILWNSLGPQWVFIAGVAIAAVFTAMCFLVPGKKPTIVVPSVTA
jgi:predicted MFS family arabinose efflux permease